MSERFGLSHRQVVAGQVGEKVSREQDRRAAMEGYNMAATEEGRKATEEMSKSWKVKIFGPDAKLRGAQERIVMDQTNALKTKLDLDREDFGHKMTPDEWRKHTDTVLAGAVDKFEDEDIKDQITMRYGQNLTAVTRDHEKAHAAFVQYEEREAFMNSVSTTAKMAQDDIESDDPQRIKDAEQRIREAYTQPEGMADDAYRSAMVSVVSNELAQGRGEMYEFAEREASGLRAAGAARGAEEHIRRKE